jgi:hypothetical protein
LTALRPIVERYFAQLNRKEQKKFEGPLRALRNDTMLGGLYELIIGLAFHILGFQVEHDPELDELTPDMFVSKDDCEFVCEVVTLFDSERNQTGEAIMDDIHYRLNSLVQSDYIVILHYPELPAQIDIPRFVRKAAALINQQTEAEFTIDVTVDSLHVGITGMRTGSDEDGKVIGRSCVGSWGDCSARLKQKLKNKAKKYKGMRYPLVLAVCEPGNMQHLGLSDALYGEEMMFINIGAGEHGKRAFTRRKDDGLFSLLYRGDEASLPHVTGVLHARLDPSSTKVLLKVVYCTNPYKKSSIPESKLQGIPKFLVQEHADELSLAWEGSELPPLELA